MKKNIFVVAVAIFAIFSTFAAKPKTALDFYNKGIELERRADYFEASQAFLQATRKNPSYSDAFHHLSRVTYELGDYSLALSYLDEAIKLSRENNELQIFRGYILISLNRLDEAQKVFEAILKKYPNDVESRFGLAQIQIFNGRLNGAKDFYLDALKREGRNKKALLSLALLSAETENWEASENYIEQALQFHSGEAEVHFLAAYLDARRENFSEAERRARSALQIRPQFTKAYTLLATILFHESRFQEVIDISDYQIAQNRNEISAWYLKGLSQLKMGEADKAIATWNTALSIEPTDEIMRASLELLVVKNLALEDKRRVGWADFHTKKAQELGKRFNSVEARYEYQRALRLNPRDEKARIAFAEMLSLDGLNEQYLDQLKFVLDNRPKVPEPVEGTVRQGSPSVAGKTYEDIRIDDRVEAYDSLLKSSLAKKWNVEPFYLDKTRWNIGLYSISSQIQLVHPELETTTAQMLSEIFTGIATTSVALQNQKVADFAEAYTNAKKTGQDYFVLLSVEETEREVFINAEIYSGRTGTKTAEVSSFRTGNDRFNSALRSIRRDLLDLLPVRGKILERQGSDILIDLGKTEGIVKGTVLNVIHQGGIRTADTGKGIVFDDRDVLGRITVTEVSEEISQGVLSDTGFYDRVNLNDEVVILAVPDENGVVTLPQITEDTAPAADNNGKKRFGKKKGDDGAKKVPQRRPAILELIREIQ